MCGTFVAALQTRVNPALFDSVGFILLMVLIGAIGFYLGIDIPRLRMQPRVDPVELMSATGTFLAAVAALISVHAFVFDEIPRRAWDFTVVSWWMLGVAMQIGAGAIARLRLARKAPRRRPGRAAGMRQKEKFSCGINVIWVVQSPSAKIFRFRRRANQIYDLRHPAIEGRFAIVTDVGAGCGGREQRQRRRRSLRTAKSCGPDAPTLASMRNSSARRRWQKSPVTGESTKETVKTIRVRECRVISGGPVVTTLVCFVLFRTRGCGCIGRPAFPTPSFLGVKGFARLGAIPAPRECERASFLAV